MATGKHNITANQGETFNFSFTISTDGTPWDLTGYTARMQVRTTVEATDKLLDLTTSSGITLGGSAGTVAITVSATGMAALISGRHVYDIEVVSGSGTVTRILEGKFIVKAEVTR
jgi:hypothetical protein